jgi:SRSO17 transposase
MEWEMTERMQKLRKWGATALAVFSTLAGATQAQADSEHSISVGKQIVGQ